MHITILIHYYQWQYFHWYYMYIRRMKPFSTITSHWDRISLYSIVYNTEFEWIYRIEPIWMNMAFRMFIWTSFVIYSTIPYIQHTVQDETMIWTPLLLRDYFRFMMFHLTICISIFDENSILLWYIQE